MKTPPPPPMPADLFLSDTSAIFVGRETELTTLKTGLAAVQQGQGRFFLLVGEPGIGKTRLAEEFAAFAHQQRALVFWGRCWEGEGAPAFWPWRRILGACAEQASAETLKEDMGAGAIDIAQIVPSLLERLSIFPPPSNPDPAQARFRLFESVTTFFRNAGRRQPIVLILDDLHWADRSSLQLLLFLVRDLTTVPIVLLGTYRDVEIQVGHPLADDLSRLTREGQRLDLGGLSEEAVATFLASSLGNMLLPEHVHMIVSRTNGNPLFVRELARLLKPTMESQVAPASLEREPPIPSSIRDVMRQRLQRLPPLCHTLLGLASVLGREFSLDVLLQAGETVGLKRASLFSLLDKVCAAHLLEKTSNNEPRYRFIHALLCETIYEDLPLADRFRLHQQVGETLERQARGSDGALFEELAYHFFQAAPGGTTEKALDYAMAAGEACAARLAYDEAARHYERALILLRSQVSNPQRQCLAFLALGSAQMQAGHTTPARNSLTQAIDIARELNTQNQSTQAAELFARAVLVLSGVWVATGTGVVDEALVPLLEEALSLLSAEDSSLRARLFARLAAELRWSASKEQKIRWLVQAEQNAQRLEDQATLAYVLAAKHWTLWTPENLDERLELTQEIILAAGAAKDFPTLLMGHTWRLAALLEYGDIAAVDHQIETVSRLAEEHRQPLYLWWAKGLANMRTLLSGRFAGLEPHLQEALLMGERIDAPDRIQSFGAQMAMLYSQQGRLEEFAPAIIGFIEQYPAVSTWQCVLAHLYSELGQREEAQRTFAPLAVKQFTDIPVDEHWAMSFVILAETCWFLGDRAAAPLLYERLLPFADRNTVAGPATVCYGAVARVLGLLATLLSHWKEAEQHFEAALRLNTRMEARSFAAQTLYNHAQMLRLRDRPEDRNKARGLLDQAFAIADELGMQKLRQSVADLRAHLGDPREQEEGTTQPQSASFSQDNQIRRQGSYWQISHEGVTIRLRTTKGLHYLSYLLLHPNREVHVFDLLTLTDQQPLNTGGVRSPAALLAQGLTITDETASSSPPDAQARTAYKERLEELFGLREEAERRNDFERLSRLTTEIEALSQELTQAYGYQHASRRNETVERARKAVTNRIRAALNKIQKAHPLLWRSLFSTVKTGTFCSYRPDPPVEWRIEEVR